MSLTEPSLAYRPHAYPWAYDFWERQQAMHWLPKEVSLSDDIKEFNQLDPKMKSLVVNTFRMFVQADIDVQNCYHRIFQSIFKPTEVGMMLAAFSNMECFDDKSELLTSVGWKLCQDISDADDVAQYDLATGAISFVRPERVVSYPYNGKMHHYANRSTDICVTPNHDLILIHPASGKRNKRKSEEGSWARNYKYPSAGTAAGLKSECTPLERVLIAVAADGCIRGLCPSGRDTWRTVDVGISKRHKIVRLREHLISADIEFSERLLDDGRVNFCFRVPDSIALESIKKLDFLEISDLNALGAADTVEEILWWDGAVTKKTSAFYSTERAAIDKTQAMCVLAGISSVVGVNRNAGDFVDIILPNGRKPKYAKECFVLTMSDRVERTYPQRNEIDYSGRVYCVSVPTQNLVSRRNGRVACTGNTVHIAAYSHLIDSLGLPVSEYNAFLEYEEMKAKHDFMREFDPQNPIETALSLAGVSAFGEGLQLFASFAILLNFPRQNLLKGMGQIVSWSVRDESLHCDGIMRLYHTYLAENPSIDREELSARVRAMAVKVVDAEDKFIDLVFSEGDVPGLTKSELKQYIRYVCNMRLRGLNEPDLFDAPRNPIPWVDSQAVGIEHANFFERQGTEYSKASTVGDWSDVFETAR